MLFSQKVKRWTRGMCIFCDSNLLIWKNYQWPIIGGYCYPSSCTRFVGLNLLSWLVHLFSLESYRVSWYSVSTTFFTPSKLNGENRRFYLMTHSTHFIYGYIASDSEIGNHLPHGLLFPISSKGSLICIIPQTGYHIPWPLLHQSWITGWNVK